MRHIIYEDIKDLCWTFARMMGLFMVEIEAVKY